MRIVYVTHNEIPGTSAAGVNVMHMAQALSGAGHEVTLLATANTDPSMSAAAAHDYYGTSRNFEITTIKHTRLANLGRLQFAAKCLKELRRRRPDLVYSRELLTCDLALRAGLRTVFEAHHPIHRESYVKRLMLRRLGDSPRVPALVAISKALADVIVEESGVPAHKLVIAHDGAEEPPVRMPKAPLIETSGACQVGYVGSLHPGKGVELIATLAPKVPGVQFHVVGGHAEQVDHWRGAATSNNICFYGRVDPAHVYSYINAMDICLLPNQPVVRSKGGNDIAQFTSPLKMFEYMAAGKAIVCSDLPVLREVLDDTTGMLVNATDPQAWAAAIATLASDRVRRDQLGEAARRRFREQFTWTMRARHVLSHV